MIFRDFVLTCVALVLGSLPASAQATPQDRPVKVVFYPILFQVPIYGATVSAPPVEGGGGGDSGASGSGSTDLSLNAAYMGGFEVNAHRFLGELDFFWTKPSALRETPRVEVKSEIWLVTMKGGYQFYKGLSLNGGVRRLSLNLDNTLELPSFGVTLQGTTTAILWDPFVGVDWRRDLNAKFTINLAAERGGFNVGTDSDWQLHGRFDWQVLRHLTLRGGYEMFHFTWTKDDVRFGTSQRTLGTTQTLHGPEFGVGIVF